MKKKRKTTSKTASKAKRSGRTGARTKVTRRGGASKASKPARAKAAARRRTAAPEPAVAPDTELEAAAFRRLIAHFDSRKDVQNIELMILAGFCRNCLSRWLVEAAQERGLDLDVERARAKVYGMPYAQWKERYQQPATAEQMQRFEAAEKAAKPGGQ
jgi:hypothetical protein